MLAGNPGLSSGEAIPEDRERKNFRYDSRIGAIEPELGEVIPRTACDIPSRRGSTNKPATCISFERLLDMRASELPSGTLWSIARTFARQSAVSANLWIVHF